CVAAFIANSPADSRRFAQIRSDSPRYAAATISVIHTIAMEDGGRPVGLIQPQPIDHILVVSAPCPARGACLHLAPESKCSRLRQSPLARSGAPPHRRLPLFAYPFSPTAPHPIPTIATIATIPTIPTIATIPFNFVRAATTSEQAVGSGNSKEQAVWWRAEGYGDHQRAAPQPIAATAAPRCCREHPQAPTSQWSGMNQLAALRYDMVAAFR